MSKFEKWFDKQLDNENAFTSDEHICKQAWKAATEESDNRIAELKAKVSELDGRLGSRNLHKEHEYLQRMNELQANINVLREALEWIDRDYGTIGIHSIVTSALSKTPAQHINNDVLIFTKDSLQAHDNDLIEKCAIVCDGYTHGAWFADKIRALIEKE